MSVFEGVKFFCASSFPDHRRAQLSLLLNQYGAKEVPLAYAEYIIANAPEFEGHGEVKDRAYIVTVCCNRLPLDLMSHTCLVRTFG